MLPQDALGFTCSLQLNGDRYWTNASKAIAVPENHSWTEKPLPVEHLASLCLRF